jgi:hypothetical protein
VTVFFTLLEKSLYYGPIDPKPKELALEEVSELLNKTISSSKFVIPFVVSDKEVMLLSILLKQTFVPRIELGLDCVNLIASQTQAQSWQKMSVPKLNAWF